LTGGIGASCNGLNHVFSFSAESAVLSVFFEPFFFLLLAGSCSGYSNCFSARVELWDLFSQVDSEELMGMEDASSSLPSVDVEEAPQSGEGGLATPLEAKADAFVIGDRTLGLEWASTAVVAELWLSLGSVSASSAQLVPVGNSDAKGDVDEASLAGVMFPDGDLLEVADTPEELNPFAACAYEKGTAGGGISGFACVDAILGDRNLAYVENVVRVAAAD
jgi:hypothetical protein